MSSAVKHHARRLPKICARVLAEVTLNLRGPAI